MSKLIVVALLAVGLSLPAFAQNDNPTNNPNVMPPLATVEPTPVMPQVTIGQIGTDFLKFLQDAEPFYTNGNVRIALGGAKVDKRWGGLLDVDIPLALNGQIGMGFAGLFLSKGNGQAASFYAGAVNLQAGTTWTILSQKVNTWMASGPGYNNSTHSAILYSAAGATWNTHLGSGELSVSGGGVNVSDAPGIGYFAALSYGWHL